MKKSVKPMKKPVKSRFLVHAFTPPSAEVATPGLPENTWTAESPEQVGRIVHNCSRKIAGVARVQIDILRTHHCPAVASGSVGPWEITVCIDESPHAMYGCGGAGYVLVWDPVKAWEARIAARADNWYAPTTDNVTVARDWGGELVLKAIEKAQELRDGAWKDHFIQVIISRDPETKRIGVLIARW